MQAAIPPVVHVVGNACTDISWTVSRFPLVGETLVASSVSEDLGGKGLNQAVAAARTGATVRLWAAVGRDEAALRIRRRLAEEGMAEETLTAFEGASDLSSILIDEAGDNMIVSHIGCAGAYDPLGEGGLTREVKAGDIVVMQGNLAPEATAACLAFAKDAGAVTILNPSPIARVTEMPWPFVDWAVMNRGEAQALTAKPEPHAAARRLLAMGARGVIVTLGAAGAQLVTEDQSRSIVAPAAAAVDTAGAGDVVCGVFAGLLARREPPVGALEAAIAAASLSVSRPGTLSACPTRAEIATLIRSPSTQGDRDGGADERQPRQNANEPRGAQ